MTLSFFASRSIAEAIHSEMPADQPPLERAAEILRDARPIAIAEYASVGRTIQKALAPRVAKGAGTERQGAPQCALAVRERQELQEVLRRDGT